MDTSNKKNHTGLTLGVDLGGTNVRVGLVENGKVIRHSAARIPKTETDKQKVLQCIVDTINTVFTPEVEGIGIGIPGLMDKQQGIIHAITNIPSFTSFPIKKILSDHFQVPVCIDNDVNCFVLGEKFYGAGKNFRNVVGLSLGTGMGVGIITANQLLEDANGGSGEFGEVPYRDANLEAYCSGMFFKRTLGVTGDEAFVLAREGNRDALEAFHQFGMHLGKAIHIILLALDPQAIIIGGSAALSKLYFHDAMMQEVANYVYKNSLKNLTIAYATEKYSPILGAAKLLETSTMHLPKQG